MHIVVLSACSFCRAMLTRIDLAVTRADYESTLTKRKEQAAMAGKTARVTADQDDLVVAAVADATCLSRASTGSGKEPLLGTSPVPATDAGAAGAGGSATCPSSNGSTTAMDGMPTLSLTGLQSEAGSLGGLVGSRDASAAGNCEGQRCPTAEGTGGAGNNCSGSAGSVSPLQYSSAQAGGPGDSSSSTSGLAESSAAKKQRLKHDWAKAAARRMEVCLRRRLMLKGVNLVASMSSPAAVGTEQCGEEQLVALLYGSVGSGPRKGARRTKNG